MLQFLCLCLSTFIFTWHNYLTLVFVLVLVLASLVKTRLKDFIFPQAVNNWLHKSRAPRPLPYLISWTSFLMPFFWQWQHLCMFWLSGLDPVDLAGQAKVFIWRKVDVAWRVTWARLPFWPSQLCVSHVNGWLSFVRKCRKNVGKVGLLKVAQISRWPPAQTTFLQIK